MALTQDEQKIFDAVISALATNAKSISQLVQKSDIGATDYIEISGGKKMLLSDLRDICQQLTASDRAELDNATTNITSLLGQVGAADGIATLNRLGELSHGQFPAGKDNVLTFADFSDVSELESGSPSGLGVQSARVLFSSALGKFYQEVTLTDGSVKNYGEWSDAARYGTYEPMLGMTFTEPQTGKIYVCKKDGAVWVKDGAQNALRELGTAGPVKGYMFEEEYDGPFSSSDNTATADGTVCYNPATERFMLRAEGASGDMYLNNWAGKEEYGEEYDEHGLIPLPGMYVCYSEMKLRYVYEFMEGLYSVELLNAGDIRSALAGKQAKLNSSTDISVGSSLSITERGKQKLFDDLWKQGYDCTVDHTKPASEQYVCNGVQMSYAEAVAVYNAPRITYNVFAGCTSLIGAPKTLILASEGSNGKAVSLNNAFRTPTLEILRVACGTHTAMVNELYYAFYGCTNLRKILGNINVSVIKNNNYLMSNAFYLCNKLEEVRIMQLMANIHFGASPKISLESLQFLVTNAANGTAAITVTVHPDVYAKLTGDTDNAAAAALTAGELAEWQALMITAAGKNIALASA